MILRKNTNHFSSFANLFFFCSQQPTTMLYFLCVYISVVDFILFLVCYTFQISVGWVWIVKRMCAGTSIWNPFHVTFVFLYVLPPQFITVTHIMSNVSKLVWHVLPVIMSILDTNNLTALGPCSLSTAQLAWNVVCYCFVHITIL